MNLLMNLLYLLPKNMISRWTGWLVSRRLPRPLAALSIRIFAKIFKIQLDEAELPVEQYKHIADFFIRRLKPGIRPLADAPLVHPADSMITQISDIKDGQLIQAKDKNYSVGGLTADGLVSHQVESGFFVTYYLCPTDYHRVHSPVSGKVLSVTHIPGALWPVNQWSTQNISELFCKNERLVIEIESQIGPVFVVFVGATNVGQMSLVFDPKITSNHCDLRTIMKKTYDDVTLKKGDELGIFHMGSTVVVLYSAAAKKYLQMVRLPDLVGRHVKMGQSFI